MLTKPVHLCEINTKPTLACACELVAKKETSSHYYKLSFQCVWVFHAIPHVVGIMGHYNNSLYERESQQLHENDWHTKAQRQQSKGLALLPPPPLEEEGKREGRQTCTWVIGFAHQKNAPRIK